MARVSAHAQRLFVHVKQQHGATVVAVDEGEHRFFVSPNKHTFSGEEHVIVIARQAFELEP